VQPQRMFMLAGAILLAAAGTHAGEIRLRPSAAVGADAPVTLRDIAELRGEDCQYLAGITVAARGRDLLGPENSPHVGAAGVFAEIDLDQAREALRAGGADLARHTLSGRTCVVRVLGLPAIAPGTDHPGEREPDFEIVDPLSPDTAGTIRARVAETIAACIGADTARMQLRFSRRDLPLLSRHESAALEGPVASRVVVQPASAVGERMIVRIRIYDGTRIAESHTVAMDVRTLRPVVVVTQELGRKADLLPAALREEEQWIAPGDDGGEPIGSTAAAIGKQARTRLEVGTILRASHLDEALLIRRGELVTVHCLRGSFEVRLRARARQDGRLGETIPLRAEDADEDFLARVDGPGRAVVIGE